MMRHTYSGAALALTIAATLAGPALAQQAVSAPPAAAGAQAAAQTPAPRTVTGRELMTPQERAAFRREMQQVAPEQRDQLWQQKRTELAQRATQRGVVLAEPGAGRGGAAGEGRGRGRGEEGGWMSRMLRWGPRAP